MAAGEVENVAYQFMMNLGRGVEWDPEEFDAVAAVIPAFKFGIVVTGAQFNSAKFCSNCSLTHGLRYIMVTG